MDLDERITKLPKWAQQIIERQRSDIAYLRAQLAADDVMDSAISWEMGEHSHGLPQHCTVSFGADYPNRVRVRLDRHGNVRVTGDDTLKIQPQASNVIIVRSEAFRA
jgi:hypothetical protein